jgi:tetratricopeptide (TPR) repeat protein
VTSRPDSRLTGAAEAIARGELAAAYPPLAALLKVEPGHVGALHLMADLARRMGRHGDAIRMLVRALDRTPGYEPAWRTLAEVLHAVPPAAGLAEVERQLARHPKSIGYRNLKGAMLDRTGDYEAAIAVFRDILADHPAMASAWTMIGHFEKVLGRVDAAEAAYRAAIRLAPASSEPYGALADMKSFRFGAADVAAMQALLARPDLPAAHRAHLDFALGRALELAGDYAASFAHYAAANRLRRAAIRHDADAGPRMIDQAEALFTPAFFAARAGWGCPAADPIFIVGMPRSGSTLVDQILASHADIEGTRELNDLPAIVRQIAQIAPRDAVRGYPQILARLSETEVAALGQRYLETTQAQRKTDRPRFIDKLPANYRFVGLIRLILPNARIIDVRRDPLACGLSIFKQDFAGGHSYAFDLKEIGATLASYAQMMALWQDILPGHVHTLRYEALVEDTEREVRRLLGYLGLPFDPACLRFHETARAVRTPSADQVRRPINDEGLDQWRHYTPWLAPLRDGLGKGVVPPDQ